MPSKFTPLEPIGEAHHIGTRESTRGAYWYLRFYQPSDRRYFFYSLKLPYEEGSRSNLNQARRLAGKKLPDLQSNSDEGIFPTLKITPEYARRAYLKDIEKKAIANQEMIDKGQQPVYEVEGGRGYWDIKRYEDAFTKVEHSIREFFSEEGLATTPIRYVKQKDLDKFKNWALRNYEWAPATVNRAIVQIRMIWRYSMRKDWVDFVPTLSQAAPNLANRKRRALTPAEYLTIIETSRKKYTSMMNKGISEGAKFDLAYMFHLWVLIMANCGVRPAAGQVDRNLIRWRDIIEEEVDGKNRKFIKRTGEKAHLDYEAVVLENAHEYIEALRGLQKSRGVYNEKEGYLFCHTFDLGGTKAGEPVKSFKTAWKSNLKECGLDSPVGTPQSKKLLPYSCRGFFMTQRLQSSDNLRIEDLAKATGSSREVIEIIYYDYSTRKNYKPLTEGANKRGRKKEAIYKDGIYIGREG
ncbi:PepSY domain-containing protein [Luminiphilus sp.]|nr:PepSY domain-containing protein [Luminiphilus sp.]